MEKEEQEEEEQEEAEEEVSSVLKLGQIVGYLYMYRNLSMYHDHSVYSCSFAEIERTLCTTGGTTVVV